MNRFQIARIHFDMWFRRQVEKARWRVLRAVPVSWLYYLTIQAVVRTIGGSEHPDALGVMEVARRLGAARHA